MGPRQIRVPKKELWRINIKQAIQGLFTTGTSEKKEKVGGKRGLTLRFAQVTVMSSTATKDVPIILQA